MSPKILAIETTTEACSAALLHQGLIQEHYQLAPRQHTHLILPMLEALLDEATLKPRDLDAIAFCRGPGSFTGSRIGASIAQAIAFAAEIPVILVSSLQCLAQGAYRELQAERVLAAIDARMHEIYWASYQLNAEGIMSEVDAEQLSNPQQMPLTNNRYSQQLDFRQGAVRVSNRSVCAIHEDCELSGNTAENSSAKSISNFIGVGSAWDTYHEKLALHFKKQLQQWVPQRYPRAYDVALLAAHSFQKGHFVSAAEALPVYLREKIC